MRRRRSSRTSRVIVVAVASTFALTLVQPPSASAHGMNDRHAAVAQGPTDREINWRQRFPRRSPPALSGASMAYDDNYRDTILFGGFDSDAQQFFGKTWSWDGTTWSELPLTKSPPRRYQAAFGYDGKHRQFVMHGGLGTGFSHLSDTWVLSRSDGQWKRRKTHTSPVLTGASMAYDYVHRQLIMFGGADAEGKLHNQTWLWTGRDWTLLHPDTSPPARASAGFSYDRAREKPVLFGGEGAAGALNDTWNWNGTTWTDEHIDDAPPGRWDFGLSYLEIRLVVFGGHDSDTVFGDTWVLMKDNWQKWEPPVSPPARFGARMAWDSVKRRALLFGGEDPSAGDSPFADSWVLSQGWH